MAEYGSVCWVCERRKRKTDRLRSSYLLSVPADLYESKRCPRLYHEYVYRSFIPGSGNRIWNPETSDRRSQKQRSFKAFPQCLRLRQTGIWKTGVWTIRILDGTRNLTDLQNGYSDWFSYVILVKRLWRSTQEAEGTGFENQQTWKRAGVRIPPSPP